MSSIPLSSVSIWCARSLTPGQTAINSHLSPTARVHGVVSSVRLRSRIKWRILSMVGFSFNQRTLPDANWTECGMCFGYSAFVKNRYSPQTAYAFSSIRTIRLIREFASWRNVKRARVDHFDWTRSNFWSARIILASVRIMRRVLS